MPRSSFWNAEMNLSIKELAGWVTICNKDKGIRCGEESIVPFKIATIQHPQDYYDSDSDEYKK
jgi:hypothetical protein